jgi:hypothetical protein
MFELLTGDPVWANEYAKFVSDKSFARPDETISFDAATDATRRLVELYKRHRH